MNQDWHDHHVSREHLDTGSCVEAAIGAWAESTYHTGDRLETSHILAPTWTGDATLSTEEGYPTFLPDQSPVFSQSHYGPLFPDNEYPVPHQLNALYSGPPIATGGLEEWTDPSYHTLDPSFLDPAQNPHPSTTQAELLPFTSSFDPRIRPRTRPCSDASYADALRAPASTTTGGSMVPVQIDTAWSPDDRRLAATPSPEPPHTRQSVALASEELPSTSIAGRGASGSSRAYERHPRKPGGYSCDGPDCTYTTDRHRDLVRHQRNHQSKHSLPRHHKCGFCDKDFHYRKDLSRHEITHSRFMRSRIKQFTCPRCATSMTRKDNMTRHMVVKHEMDVETVRELLDHG